VNDTFRRVAARVSEACGSPWAFIISVLVIVIWGVTGPIFDYSDTWQLVINTGTTVVTFLMVFLIQNTQNRDSRAVHLKLDELLRGVSGARTGLMNLEDLTDDQLEELKVEFERIRQHAQRAVATAESAEAAASEASDPEAARLAAEAAEAAAAEAAKAAKAATATEEAARAGFIASNGTKDG